MKHQNSLLENAHEMAQGLYAVGAIDDKEMQEFAQLCLSPVESLDGAAIRAIREKEALTQAAFAFHLNISQNQVSAWERGVKKPSGAALKLLNIIKHKGIDAIAY